MNANHGREPGTAVLDGPFVRTHDANIFFNFLVTFKKINLQNYRSTINTSNSLTIIEIFFLLCDNI